MEVIIKGRYDLGLLLLVRCGQLYLSSNQIAVFFDPQYLWKESSDILVFCTELFIKWRYHQRQLFLVGCGQLFNSSNQIAGFFGHQYLWKELSVLFFYMELVISWRYHLKVLLLVVPLIQSDDWILWSKISHQRVNGYLSFWHGDSYQGKVASETTTRA